MVVLSEIPATFLHNSWLTEYTSRLVVPGKRQEIIQDLGEHLSGMLEEYRRAHGDHFPDHVLLLRDGVADNQMEALMD